MLYGAGGNIGLCAGADGAVLVDDEFAPLSEKIQAAVKQAGDQPIRWVINTHWHGDYVGCNEKMATAGGTMAAKPTAPWDEAWGKGFVKPESFTTVLYNEVSKKKL